MQSGESGDLLGDSQFFDPEKFFYAENLEPAEVIMRIEATVKEFIIQASSSDKRVGFQLVKPSSSNAFLLRNEIHLGKSKKNTYLMSETSALNFCRIWKVLSFVYGLLQSKKQATQREAYYCMVNDFSSQLQLNRAILEVCSLLQCTRRSLGLMAGSKGELAGMVQIQYKPEAPWFDCSRVPLLISGEMNPLIKVTSQARYILVIEKDGIFQRLCEDRIHQKIPCVLICGKGYPDLATRAMVRQMQDKLNLPVLGIVDYNVHGLGILLTYKLGSVRLGLESFRYATDVKWLALRGKSLEALDLPEKSFQELTPRDHAKIDSLLASPIVKQNVGYEEELRLMKRMSRKAELQVLFHLGPEGITKFLCKMILSKQWI